MLKMMIFHGNKLLFNSLLFVGLNVDYPDGQGQTALLVASRQGNVAIVRLLLAYGADPNKYVYRYCISEKTVVPIVFLCTVVILLVLGGYHVG